MNTGREILLGEHKWRLPELPTSQDMVLFSRESKHNQYWRRNEDFPRFFTNYNPFCITDSSRTLWDDNDVLIELSREDTQLLQRLQDQEMWRRQNGVWFMNDGDPTFLTGDHYFQLQWGQMYGYVDKETGSPYGRYREFQAQYQYFLQMCWESTDKHGDRNCSAQLTVKPKKTGITQLLALNFLNRASMMKEKLIGMMSKSEEDVLMANFNYFLHALDNMPGIFRPEEAKRNQSEIKFGIPDARPTGSMKNRLKSLHTDQGLKTSMFCKPLRDNAFDGLLMYMYWCDEWCKYTDKATPAKVKKKTSETVKVQDDIRGMGNWTSYTSETDGLTHEEAKDIWDNSKMRTFNEDTGRTNNEFFSYFISAEYSGETGFDPHGRADCDKNRTKIMMRRKQMENSPSDLQAYMRQYPLTEEEAWRQGGGGGTTYDNLRLGIRQQVILGEITAGNLRYTEGWFEWKDGMRLGEAYFRPITRDEKLRRVEAPFRFYGWEEIWSKRPELFNRLFQNSRDNRGLLNPDALGMFCGATDPTEYAQKKGLKEYSKMGMTVMIMPSPTLNAEMEAPISNRFICTYHYRHDNPRDGYEDWLKKIYFFGCLDALEGNREWLRTFAVDDGLQNLILVWDKELRAIAVYDEFKNQGVLRVTGSGDDSIIAAYVRAKKMYYAVSGEGETDYLNLMEDERIIAEDMSFDPADTKRFDLSVCSSWNILAVQSLMGVRGRKVSREADFTPMQLQQIMDIML